MTPRLTRGARAATLALGLAATLAAGGCAAFDDAVKDETSTKTYQQPINRIEIEVDGGDVVLTAGGDGEVAVTSKLKWISQKPAITQAWNGNTLTIVADCKPQPRCDADVTVALPAGVQAVVRSGGGDIRTVGLGGAQDLQTSGGDVKVNGASGQLTMRTDGGDISGVTLSAPHTTADTDGGDVDLAFTAAPASVSAESAGGDVTVAVPTLEAGTPGYRVQADTDGGSRTVDVSSDGAGTRTINAHSDGGDVRVRYA